MDTFRGLIRNPRARSWMVGALAVLAAAVWLWLPDRRSDAAGPPHTGDKPISVDVANVKRTDVPVYLDGLGTIQAFNTVTVTARVDGELQKIAFEEGKTVNKGDLLAQIDPRPFQAALELALAAKAKDEAQLQSAKADLERYLTLAP
ncbi:MAG TPA: biotin/lipoyl-binding protein, partial [Steroidobacteraceae bacterium]|nr:biotin/lipoyl-binding protein [Steroidobacteraceae bacterium]